MPKPNSQAWNDRRVVSRMAASLDRLDHAVLALRFGEHLSTGETAAVLRIDPSEVESAVRRASSVIRRSMTDD
ncbi:MAG: sigma-70 region 4 domain-containing protein [Phycisphaerales bacterium]|nr:sigma-70 region 4 domain-containing protein [Phycisphaerales bacterium]